MKLNSKLPWHSWFSNTIHSISVTLLTVSKLDTSNNLTKLAKSTPCNQITALKVHTIMLTQRLSPLWTALIRMCNSPTTFHILMGLISISVQGIGTSVRHEEKSNGNLPTIRLFLKFGQSELLILPTQGITLQLLKYTNAPQEIKSKDLPTPSAPCFTIIKLRQ